MKYPFEDLEVVRSRSSIRWAGVWTHILWLSGAVFVIIGVGYERYCEILKYGISVLLQDNYAVKRILFMSLFHSSIIYVIYKGIKAKFE